MQKHPQRNDQSPFTASAASPRRRTLLKWTGAGVAAAALAPLAVRAQGAKHIRFAHPAPIAHGWNVWAERFKHEIEQKSGGKITVQIFPNAQMGNERDTAQAVRLGSIEMGAIGVGLMNWVPEMSITDAPFLWKSREQAVKAFAGEFGSDLRKRCRDKGFVLTGWTDLGFRSMTNNKRAIKSVQDMQGLKMRVPNSKAYIAMIQAMGASTVAIDLSELYLALRQGVADGQDTPAPVVVSNKYYEVQKFMSRTNHNLTTAYTVTNPKFYDGLTAAERAMFDACCLDADEFLRQKTIKDEAAAYDFCKSKGMEVTLDVDAESFRKACTPVIAGNPDLFLPSLVKMAQATPT
jgi:tripartite ATP-independent transporter DctP family solute receptor